MINKLKSIFLLFFITGCYSPEKIEENTQNIHDQISSNVEITLTKKGNITAKIQSTTLKKNNETLKFDIILIAFIRK